MSLVTMSGGARLRVRSGGFVGGDTYRGVNLPSGITAPASLGAAFGGAVWDITDLIVGSSRYNAATTLTVTTTGATGRTDLLAHLTTHAAGSVDHKIIVPTATLSGGQYTLPSKTDPTKHCWIVTEDIHDGTFGTARGTKIPAATTGMTILEGPAAASDSIVIFADSGNARGYSFHGCVIQNNQTNAAYDVALGLIECRRVAAQSALSGYPGRLYLDRCWLRGSPTTDVRRGIMANGPYMWAEDSRITDIHTVGNESAGVGGWTGSQFHSWINMTIEAASQTILYGGADPDQSGTNTLDPADIFTDRVYAHKPLTWLTTHGSYAGIAWTVKTGFEAKNVRRWVIDRSVSENCWPSAQTGYAMLFQNLSDNNTNHTENRVEDVVVRHHKFNYVAHGLSLLSRVVYNGGTLPTNPATRLVFDNILLTRVGGNNTGSDTVIKNGVEGTVGFGMLLQSDIGTLTIDRWTADGARGIYLSGSGGSGWTLTNFVHRLGLYGIIRDGGLVANAALAASCATNLTTDGNVGYDLSDGSAANFSPGWDADETNASMLFTDYAGYDYRLTSAHLTKGVDGGEPGCDIDTLNTQLAGVS